MADDLYDCFEKEELGNFPPAEDNESKIIMKWMAVRIHSKLLIQQFILLRANYLVSLLSVTATETPTL